jgi:restriction endonuclease S subunit
MNNLEANDWVETSIRDLEGVGAIELGRGKIISQKDIDADPGEYPVYSSSARGRGEFGRYGKYMFDEELVTWSVDGGGKFFYRPQGRYSITNVSGFLRVKDKEMLDTYYAWAHLYSLWQTMTFNYTEKLHPSVLRDRFRFSYPPLPHQRIIGEILKTVQRAIEAQERIIQTTTELKQALMQKLFSEGLRGEPQKETEIGLVPESWGVVELGRYFQIKHGFAFEGEFFEPSGDHVLMTPGHFHEEGGFRDQGDKTKYFTGDIPQEYILAKNDLVVAMTEQKSGLLGSAAFVPESGRYLHNQRLGLIIDLDTKRLCKGYLFHVFNFPLLRVEVAKTSTGSKVKHTSPTKLRAVKVPIPHTLEEQEEIASALSATQQKIRIATSREKELRDLFRTLLHQLMTAEIRINVVIPPFPGP